MNITKANGELVPFDSKKIRRSLKRVNASSGDIERVIEKVENEISDGISTAKLYRIVFRELKKLKKGVAGKYNLKRAIMALGPTGFPFEEFIASLWRAEGFSVQTGLIMKGACVSHEIDVFAEQDDIVEFVECKHHSVRGKVCSVRIPLYFYARFLDLERRRVSQSGGREKRHKGWLVTNMRFTSDALDYGTCVGLGLMSWDFPPKDGLRDRIGKFGLHPITCLTSVSKQKLQKLMNKKITLCMDLCEHPEVLVSIGVRGAEAARVMEEAAAICGAACPQIIRK